MKSRILKFVAMGMMLCLAATSVRASVGIQSFNASLNSVDSNGNLVGAVGTSASIQNHVGGTVFYGLVNTVTGKVVGLANGFVTNDSHLPHAYINGNFGDIYGVSVCGSLYSVGSSGSAFLIAIGSINVPK